MGEFYKGEENDGSKNGVSPFFEYKNAEYHQQTFSDPLMILRMVRVAGFELPARVFGLFQRM